MSEAIKLVQTLATLTPTVLALLVSLGVVCLALFAIYAVFRLSGSGVKK